jgi:hypothetical protein
VDRATAGPFYCSIAPITDKYSPLTDNAQYCAACASDDNTHSLGPQCQVLLQQGSTSYLPQGCSDSCSPGGTPSADNSITNIKTDPLLKSQIACDGFCYPRLQIPTASSNAACGAYNTASVGNDNRSVINGAACPTACRYDFMTASGSKESDDALKSCGQFTSPSNCAGPNCYLNGIYNSHNCNPICNGLTNSSLLGTCTNEAYSCGQQTTGSYWVRVNPVAIDPNDNNACHQNVVLYDCQHPKKGDTCNNVVITQNWSANCAGLTASTFFLSQNPVTVYTCSHLHRYQGIDDLVKGSASTYTYYECGQLHQPINGVTPNTNSNFCGSVKVTGTNTALDGQTFSALSPLCQAQYNARAVACLPDASYVGPNVQASSSQPILGTPNQPLPASANCQQCPLFCRISGVDPPICDSNNWSLGGDPPQCDPTLQSGSITCDLGSASASHGLLNPPGYCGVSKDSLKLPPKGQPPSQCAWPAVGSGVGCPARCRIRLADGSLPAGCTGGEIGNACNLMSDACRASPSASPCSRCAECEEDCQSIPAVRQNCNDLCAPSDMTAGASHFTPDQLTSGFGGATGNPLWNSLGSLAIAAFILPIFCAILTLAFIRSLSPLFGGDIEIPGLLKLI